MRYGVLSDIHANLHALDAVIAALEREGIDRYLCAGDVVGYGPLPNECVDRIRSLEAATVAGNHDLAAAGRLPHVVATAFALDSMRWTSSVLTDTSRHYLGELPPVVVDGGIVVAHGALGDPQEYVVSPEQAEAQLEAMGQRAAASQVLVLGHTHAPWAYTADLGASLARGTGVVHLDPSRRHLVNPGSVGQSRDVKPDARFAVVDAGARQVTFHAIAYDTEACRAALRRLGRPAGSCHIPPSRRSRVRRTLTGLVRGRRSGVRAFRTPLR